MSRELLRLDELLGKLRRLPWRRLGVRWVLLHGSLAGRGQGRDLDLLVAGPRDALEAQELALRVSDLLGLPWGRVDVTRFEDAPCALVLEAWRHGILVYADSRGTYLDEMIRRVEVCSDYMLAARRLQVARVAVEAATRRWGRGGRHGGARQA